MLKINTKNRYGHIMPIVDALKLVTDVEETHHIPFFHIEYKGEVIGYVDVFDGFFMDKFNREVKNRIRDPKIIFKFHTCAEFDYDDNVVTCGIYRWYKPHVGMPIKWKRTIPITAQMRTMNSGQKILKKQGKPLHPWVAQRKEVIRQAELLGGKTKMESVDKYMKDLRDTQLGFIWPASAYLGWKIGEFLQHGVVMISPIMDHIYPFREDVHLMAGQHYIKCEEPEHYAEVARKVLENPDYLHFIRENIVELWREKLNPYAVGKWYLRRLHERTL